VAALIAQTTGATTDLVGGDRGEFSVRVDGRVVARKDAHGFPADEAVVTKVREALGS
jgi:predicted Rdx family selenoprotein